VTSNVFDDWIAPLQTFFAEKLGRTARIRELRRLAEGHSRQMLLAEVDDGETRHRYVIRVEQGGIFGTSSAEEYRIMRALHQAGEPVARVRWFEPSERLLGEPFFVMDYVEGEPDPPDDETVSEFVATLRRFHNIDFDKAELDFDLKPTCVQDATRMQVDRWLSVYRDGSLLPVPLLEEAAAWLRYHAPSDGPLCVVHGDPGPGNFVHAGGKILALTDFEFCHLGDPREDWVFCAVMRGPRVLDQQGWIELYRNVAGVELTAEQWHYWKAFNLFKGAAANTTALRVFCEGGNPAPNLAIVGTALHQSFLRQLTELIETSGAQP
jgi:aminoglycoside phosphotransferase (APT) family kinase protein